MVDKVRAVVMVEPGRVEVQEFPYPDLEKGAMILQVEMAGICGTDKHTYKGEMVLYAGTEAEQRGVFPCVKGHEVVGLDFSVEALTRLRELGGEPVESAAALLGVVGSLLTAVPASAQEVAAARARLSATRVELPKAGARIVGGLAHHCSAVGKDAKSVNHIQQPDFGVKAVFKAVRFCNGLFYFAKRWINTTRDRAPN